MQRIGFIVFLDFVEVLTLVTATVFEVANLVVEKQVYKLHVISETGGAVRTSIGMTVHTEAFGETTFDTLIVAGSLSPRHFSRTFRAEAGQSPAKAVVRLPRGRLVGRAIGGVCATSSASIARRPRFPLIVGFVPKFRLIVLKSRLADAIALISH
jgi:transcriptional regulator GlxA family with amidase domain